jgi:hypothetical protein
LSVRQDHDAALRMMFRTNDLIPGRACRGQADDFNDELEQIDASLVWAARIEVTCLANRHFDCHLGLS